MGSKLSQVYFRSSKCLQQHKGFSFLIRASFVWIFVSFLVIRSYRMVYSLVTALKGRLLIEMEAIIIIEWKMSALTLTLLPSRLRPHPTNSHYAYCTIFLHLRGLFNFYNNIIFLATPFYLQSCPCRLARRRPREEAALGSRFISTSFPWNVWRPIRSSHHWALFSWERSFSAHRTPSLYSCPPGRWPQSK